HRARARPIRNRDRRRTNLRWPTGSAVSSSILSFMMRLLLALALATSALAQSGTTCTAEVDREFGPSWNGWSPDGSNTRFQAAGLIPAERVPELKLKWAFGFPNVKSVFGAPTLTGGRVFLGVDTGSVYSLDAFTGCVYWTFQADGGVRS